MIQLDDRQKKILQTVGGGLIIAAAFAIMLPGFMTYVASLWRFLVLIVTIVISSWLVVFLYHKLKPKEEPFRPDESEETPEPDEKKDDDQ